MRSLFAAAGLLILFASNSVFAAQKASTSPPSKNSPDSTKDKDAQAEAALQKAVAAAGNDRAALVRSLKEYLQEYPDAPRKAGVFRALVESCQQLRDNICALDSAERLIAIQPDDSEMMLLAVSLLQKQGDDASLKRANGYVGRVLDRVEKSGAEERSPRSSPAEWQERQDKIHIRLYYLRGEIERSQKNYDAAVKDLQKSYSIRANAAAAESLGEIAELQKDLPKAIEEYSIAFSLPEGGPAMKIDRREVRMKLGNVWRQARGSDQGLGEQILATYDRLGAPSKVSAALAPSNKDAKDIFDFSLRHLDGSPLALASLKGKVVALSFWATWCGPCQELEPLFGKLAKDFGANSEVAFLAVNTDEDESRVPRFLAEEKWDLPIAFADGLDEFLNVETLPTVIVLDPAGKIVYRAGGFSPQQFSASLTTAIQSALAAPR